ncbi:coiled-coil domain-containing protein 81-like, partial [Argonauta hians]
VNLNYTTIAYETTFSRDVAENCVKELLSAFYRAINGEKNVDLVFIRIGRLSVRKRKCKMKFFRHFIDLFDKSGSLAQSMQNRLSTPDSVVTDRSQVKSTDILLPGPLKVAENLYRTNSIIEEKPKENAEENLSKEPLLVTTNRSSENPHVTTTTTTTTTPALVKENAATGNTLVDTPQGLVPAPPALVPTAPALVPTPPGLVHTPPALVHTPPGLVPAPPALVPAPPALVPTSPALVPTLQGLVTDDGNKENPFIPSLDNSEGKFDDNAFYGASPVPDPPAEFSPVLCANTNVAIENVMRTNIERDTSPGILITGQNISNSEQFHRKEDFGNFSSRSVCSVENVSPKIRSAKNRNVKNSLGGRFHNSFSALEKSVSTESLNRPRRYSSSYQKSHSAREPIIQACCDHHDSQQDMCYLCFQRQQRNVYMPFAEEKARRDKEEDLLLQKYNEMKNAEHLMMEKEKKTLLKRDLELIQKRNFEVGEMVHARKRERDVNFVQSYLFQHRPETPPLLTKMLPYGKDLQRQIEQKNLSSVKEQEKENVAGKAEQKNLISSLAKQREDFLRDRAKKRDMYKTFLDRQVQEKARNLRLSCSNEEQTNGKYDEENGCYFGKNDVTKQMLTDKRRQANETMIEQQKMVAQRKREEILKRLKQQQEEESLLKRNKEDLINDRAMKYQRNHQLYKELETDWKHRVTMKERNLMKYKEKASQLDMLVQDQCDRYHRCQQCKRCLWNRGTRNIWEDSYFLPGSRHLL